MHDNSNSTGKSGSTQQQTGRDILAALERIEAMLDEYFKANLDAKFQHGKGTDRWSRGR